MSAAELRKAAQKLRAAAVPTTQGPWMHNPINGIHTKSGTCVATTARHDDVARRADAAYIALMHSGVGLEIAEWLEVAAAGLDGRGVTARVKPAERQAIAVARLINGGAS